ncbi:MAG: DUF1428 domain-containing protein [Colwellia polaris]|jgi:uncharacterized protein YbaA (DUF1428 family)|uniref:DUF1428 domain-containing protein n=1 Tax=Colwellia polaris TaxID=326537 RepID=UPI000A176E5D|nr:DUF1428 domain-containing protein [Colwellia polaris]|tara:strand:+ start:19195 stop:19548 length:354 start_codon:yes stop_codon:yes gene_type:complete
MAYVDGFVLAVPTANKASYLALAKTMAVMFKEHGALTVVENWGDDVPDGETTSFPIAVKCQPDETVVFSWITWLSKEARDSGMKKVMADPRMSEENMTMPFDGKRMIFGGFETILTQ